jgi:regulator of protease activity HflC (stomatin/prohibitin superfamily)
VPIELPADLIAREQAAWTEIQAGQLTVDTARAVHAAVTAHAEASGEARIVVEEALKRAVRHPEAGA